MSLTQETIALSQIEKQRRSYQALSLTNFGNNLEPQIAAGGRVEDTDTLFYSGSLESITGWAGIGVSTEAYIKIIPQGDGPPETALAEFTDVAPTWSDSKQGFYGTGAAANHRYIGGLYKDAGGNYTKKWLYQSFDKSIQIIKIYGDGKIDTIDVDGDITASGDLTVGGDTVLNGAFSLGTSADWHYQTLAAGLTYYFPLGWYYIRYLGGTDLRLQFNFSHDGWQNVDKGLNYSDGAKLRFYNASGSGSSFTWQKLD